MQHGIKNLIVLMKNQITMLRYMPLLFLIFCLKSSSLFGQFSPNQFDILIQTKPNLAIDDLLKKINKENDLALFIKKEPVPEWNIYLIGNETSTQQESDILEIINKEAHILGANYNRPVTFRTTPNDSLYGEQWTYERIGLPECWDISTGGKTINEEDIVVAVVDSGFNPNHPDFEGQIWDIPIDFAANPNSKHGTKVSGVLGAKGNNSIGVTGVNWDLKMMMLSMFYPDEIASAYRFAYEQRKLYNETAGLEGAFVVALNGSFGFSNSRCGDFPILANLMDILGQAGILYIASAPNRDEDINAVGDFPSECPSDYLITVTSSNREDKRSDNAAFGKTTIDLAAPGTEILTTNEWGGYQKEVLGGTSYAAPHVSGAVALLYSMPCQKLLDLAVTNPPEAALLIKKAILEGTDPLSDFKSKTVTEGRLNVFNSMNYLHGYCIARMEEESEEQFVDTYLYNKDLVRLYPNPANDLIQLDYAVKDFQEVTVKIFNTLGQLMWEQTTSPIPFEQQTMIIDLTDWAKGTYFVTVLGFEKESTQKFIKT